MCSVFQATEILTKTYNNLPVRCIRVIESRDWSLYVLFHQGEIKLRKNCSHTKTCVGPVRFALSALEKSHHKKPYCCVSTCISELLFSITTTLPLYLSSVLYVSVCGCSESSNKCVVKTICTEPFKSSFLCSRENLFHSVPASQHIYLISATLQYLKKPALPEMVV